MPLYEYECTACHRRTEKIQKFSDPEITICPHCSGHLNRVLSAPAFSFSGGGWYADGYGSAKPAAAAAGGDTPATPASGGGSATESATPSTPAASTPSTPSAPATAASSASAEKK